MTSRTQELSVTRPSSQLRALGGLPKAGWISEDCEESGSILAAVAGLGLGLGGLLEVFP